MSERTDLPTQKAVHEFRQFIKKFMEPRARFTGFPVGKKDPLVRPTVKVPREEVKERFLSENPNYNPYRSDLDKVHPDIPYYSFDEERWGQNPGDSA